jgi:hypothetical protein
MTSTYFIFGHSFYGLKGYCLSRLCMPLLLVLDLLRWMMAPLDFLIGGLVSPVNAAKLDPLLAEDLNLNQNSSEYDYKAQLKRDPSEFNTVKLYGNAANPWAISNINKSTSIFTFDYTSESPCSKGIASLLPYVWYAFHISVLLVSLYAFWISSNTLVSVVSIYISLNAMLRIYLRNRGFAMGFGELVDNAYQNLCYLHENKVDWSQMTLHGISLGGVVLAHALVRFAKHAPAIINTTLVIDRSPNSCFDTVFSHIGLKWNKAAVLLVRFVIKLILMMSCWEFNTYGAISHLPTMFNLKVVGLVEDEIVNFNRSFANYVLAHAADKDPSKTNFDKETIIEGKNDGFVTAVLIALACFLGAVIGCWWVSNVFDRWVLAGAVLGVLGLFSTPNYVFSKIYPTCCQKGSLFKVTDSRIGHNDPIEWSTLKQADLVGSIGSGETIKYEKICFKTIASTSW